MSAARSKKTNQSVDHPTIPRFGVERIIRELQMLAKQPGGVAAMDRRAVLAEMSRRLAAPEEVVLERGFDRAYRQIVEGV